MKIWFITDTHHGTGRSSSANYKKKNARGGDFWKDSITSYYKNFFIPLLKDNFDKEQDYLFHLGDLFDVASGEWIQISDYNYTLDIYKEINEVIGNRPMFFLVGNHDMIFKHKLDDNAVLAMRHLGENIKVFSDAEKIEIGGKSFYFLPFIRSASIQKGMLRSERADFLMAHTDVYGARTSANKADVLRSSLVKEDYDNFDRIVSGHIHIKQNLFQDRWLYLGSPYQMDASDLGTDKGIYYYDFDDNKFHYFENTHSPIFIKLDIESEEDLKEIDMDYYSKNITIINVKQSMLVEANKGRDEVKSIISELNPYRFKWINDITGTKNKKEVSEYKEIKWSEAGPEFYKDIEELVAQEISDSEMMDITIKELHNVINIHKEQKN